MSDSGSRLSRWSRLKNEARQQSRLRFAVPAEPAETPVVATEASVEEAHAPEIAETDAGVETRSEAPEQEPADGADQAPELPDIDTLDASSDYTAFMSDKVSDTVRNLALRKLWRSDSVFANLDGMIDYGEDFSDAATIVEGMKSTYTVGRGMVDYEAEDAAKREAAETDEEGITPDREVAQDEAAEDADAEFAADETPDETLSQSAGQHKEDPPSLSNKYESDSAESIDTVGSRSVGV